MKIRGFTLIELLVAIAIFAVLSALGWKVFDNVLKVRDRNAEHEKNLSVLQDAYQQILRDSLQIVPLEGNVGQNKRAALVLQDGHLNFSKIGVSDPLQQGLSPSERIEYEYRADEQKLYRLRYRYVNSDGRDQPDSSILLENVEQFRVVVLNPDELTTWPNAEQQNSQDPNALKYLPRGIKLEFRMQGVDYVWVYSLLNTQFLEENSKL